MERLLVVRHGEREDTDPAWRSTAARPFDPGLTEKGRSQAMRLAQRLAADKITRIYSSPYLRAVETADRIAEVTKSQIRVESGLGEMLCPDWFPSAPEILPVAQLQERFPRVDRTYDSTVAPVYPENRQDVNARTNRVVERLVGEERGSVVIVGHGATVQGFVTCLTGNESNAVVELASLTKLAWDGKAWLLAREGDSSHLDE